MAVHLVDLAVKYARAGYLERLERLGDQFSMRTSSWDHCMVAAAIGGQREVIYHCATRGATHWDGALYYCAKHGYASLAEELADREETRDYTMAMTGAALGGHLSILRSMEERGGNDIEWALFSAAYGGHFEIVQYCIERGARKLIGAASMAHFGGHKHLAYVLRCCAKEMPPFPLGWLYRHQLAKLPVDKQWLQAVNAN